MNAKTAWIFSFVLFLISGVSLVMVIGLRNELDDMKNTFRLSPNGGLVLNRVVVRDEKGNSSVIEPGRARFFSPHDGESGNPSIVVTAMGSPYVSLIDKNGIERAIIGHAQTKETLTENKHVSGIGTLTLFDNEGNLAIQLP